MIRATVTIKTATQRLVYDTIGTSVWTIDESARELVADEPCSVSIMVLQ